MSSHHRHIRAALFAASAIGSLASAQAAFAQQDAAPQTSAAAPLASMLTGSAAADG